MQMALGGIKVQGIAVCPKDHVAGMIANDSIRMGGTIIEQVHEGLHGGLHGAGSLLGGKGTKGNQHGGVNCMGIIQEDTNNFLDAFAIVSIKGSSVVWCRGILDFGTITGVLPSVWGMLRTSGMGVTKVQKGMFNIARHGQINGMVGIVPLEGEAAVTGGGPIFGDMIMAPEGSEEVVGIVLVGVANDKVIHNQGEADVAGIMLPETRGEWAGVITMRE